MIQNDKVENYLLSVTQKLQNSSIPMKRFMDEIGIDVPESSTPIELRVAYRSWVNRMENHHWNREEFDAFKKRVEDALVVAVL